MTRLAVLSNVNIDPLKNYLQQNDSLKLYFCSYNCWQSDLLDSASALYLFDPQFVFIYLNADEFKGTLEELLSSIETFSHVAEKTNFIISNFNPPPYFVDTYSKKNDNIYLINNTLNDFALQKHNVFILDFNRLIRWYGYQNLFDDKYWYLGRIKFSNAGFKRLSLEIQNVLTCMLGKAKKVLILDLDHTLWGGILGEEGWQNVQLSQEGVGRIFVDFQKKIKQLKEMGVLLVSCSKNNESEVKEMFEKHPDMQLKWDDFILHQINWCQKSDNIAEIADLLQLGLDTMVFIDDNSRERDLIKQMLPQVETPDFPEDVSLINSWFVLDVVYPFFPKTKLTEEDKEKTNQYQRNINRLEVQKMLNYDDFLASLQIQLTITEATEKHLSRVAQLTQKTNQFNLTNKRYTEAEIFAMYADCQCKILICEYEDKFGKEGIVGCVIVKFNNQKAVLDTFLLSCRILGRNVENHFLKHILAQIKQKGIKTVEGIYHASAKNEIAKNFYIKNGFKNVDEQLFIIDNF